jgi:[acyl-carrier-protein] S-malonyltransferase
MKALIFPGQGSQKTGMGLAICESFSWASEMMHKADEILGRNISSICFNGPDEELKKTVNTQPAIFVVSAILTEWLKRNGFAFSAVAGHSLGEYNALYAASVASFEDLLKLVDLRAKAMEKACPAGTGAMSAIMMLARDVLEQVCLEASEIGVCQIANYNCPGQLVISGEANAVKKAGELALGKGARKVVPLDVSGPFHSPLMIKAKESLAAALETVTFKNASVPVYTNVDGKPTTDSLNLKTKLLNQITGSVLYEDSVNNMLANGITEFIEVGPSKVLAGLNKKISVNANTTFASDPQSLEILLKSEAV